MTDDSFPQYLEPRSPFSQDSLHHDLIIPDRLWIGEAPAREHLSTLNGLKITDIINLTRTPEVQAAEEAAGFTVHSFPFPDGGFLGRRDEAKMKLLTMAMITQAAAKLEELMQWERRTYLHCSAGISRSPTVAMFWLLESGRCGLFQEAFLKIQRARPVVSPNPELVHLVAAIRPEAFSRQKT